MEVYEGFYLVSIKAGPRISPVKGQGMAQQLNETTKSIIFWLPENLGEDAVLMFHISFAAEDMNMGFLHVALLGTLG